MSVLSITPDILLTFGTVPIHLLIWLACLTFVIVIKYEIYYCLAFLHGLQPLTPNEDFWLYDLPINPMNIPSLLVMDKIKKDPQEFYNHILKCVRHNTHCDLKFVKMFGKYFFKKLDDNEYKEWKKTSTGILTDLKTEEQVIDFMVKLKATGGKSLTENTVRVYYIPSMNNGTESGIITCGHHCL